MAVIAFHSLEDRIVKQFFKDMHAQHGAVILTKKPLTPGAGERQENLRSRSAKLRLLRKSDTTAGPAVPESPTPPPSTAEPALRTEQKSPCQNGS
jgi:hypothetical protein